MKLDTFKSVVAKQGLSKNTQWECRIYPPKDLSAQNSIFDFGIGPFNLALNLPGVDLIDDAINAISNFGVDILPGVSIGANLGLPTLGYTLRNSGGPIDRINLYCNMCSIPERDIQNVEWKDTAGESRQLGLIHTHARGMSVSYYCSEDLRERKFFEQWQNAIFNPVNKRRSYYKDYVGTMEVIKYNSTWSQIEAVYKFNEVYPSNIGAQTMTFEGSALVRLDIAFKFRNYEQIK